MRIIEKDTSQLSRLGGAMQDISGQVSRVAGRIEGVLTEAVRHPQTPNPGRIAQLGSEARQLLRLVSSQLSNVAAGTKFYARHSAEIEALLGNYEALTTVAMVNSALARLLGSKGAEQRAEKEQASIEERLLKLYATATEMHDLAGAAEASKSAWMFVPKGVRVVYLPRGYMLDPLTGFRVPVLAPRVALLETEFAITRVKPGFWASVAKLDPTKVDRVLGGLTLVIGVAQLAKGVHNLNQGVDATSNVVSGTAAMVAWYGTLELPGAAAAAAITPGAAVVGPAAAAFGFGWMVGSYEAQQFEQGYNPFTHRLGITDLLIPGKRPAEAALYGWSKLWGWAGRSQVGAATRIPHAAAIERYASARAAATQAVKKMYPDANVSSGKIDVNPNWKNFADNHDGFVVVFSKGVTNDG